MSVNVEQLREITLQGDVSLWLDVSSLLGVRISFDTGKLMSTDIIYNRI